MDISKEIVKIASSYQDFETEEKIKKLNALPKENRAVILWQWAKGNMDFKTFKEILKTVEF